MHQIKTVRILMFCREEDLELTRRLLLSYAGYALDVVRDQGSFVERLAADEKGYNAVILCHTIERNERNAAVVFARQCNTKTVILDAAIAPDQLLGRLAELR